MMNKSISYLIPIFILVFIFGLHDVTAQSNPMKLDSALGIKRLLTVKNSAIRVEMDPVTHHLFYALTSGSIYEIKKNSSGIAYDSLVYTSNTHGVFFLQGMVFHDSILYVSGNNRTDSSSTIGIIARGILNSTGKRNWDTLMLTSWYSMAGIFDHLFSGLAINPRGDSIYICSGARGDHGELQTRNGSLPGLRNLPLTTNIFALPTHRKSVIILPNDSTALATSGFLFCRGVRNHFDMAFNARGHLFGLENSGDFDHNEEMNWLQRNNHYGFPWKMGDTDNPQQFSGFVPAAEKRISHYSTSWRNGYWNNDPSFPKIKTSLILSDPIKNYGPDCDKYKDANGKVHDASDEFQSMGTFTAHRSPLGLVFDNNHLLSSNYNGDGFMLSWTKGLDSCGCTNVPDSSIGPFVDPGQDLVHLDLYFDSLAHNYKLHAKRIVANFDHPVDAALDSNKIYVLENTYSNKGAIYEVAFPVNPIPCKPSVTMIVTDVCNPQFTRVRFSVSGSLPNDFDWYAEGGKRLRTAHELYASDTITGLGPGKYYVISNDYGRCGADTFLFTIQDTLHIFVDSVKSPSCSNCSDGIIYFNWHGGSPPYHITYPSGHRTSSALLNLSAGTYPLCTYDLNNCKSCVTVKLNVVSGLATSSKGDKEFSIFPNPANDLVSISFVDDKPINFAVYTINGEEIPIEFTESINGNERNLKINSSELPNGVYTVALKMDTKSVYRKLVVMH